MMRMMLMMSVMVMMMVIVLLDDALRLQSSSERKRAGRVVGISSLSSSSLDSPCVCVWITRKSHVTLQQPQPSGVAQLRRQRQRQRQLLSQRTTVQHSGEERCRKVFSAEPVAAVDKFLCAVARRFFSWFKFVAA